MEDTSSKKFYITTSLPYANARPHVGHILDPLIADVISRYHRIKGDDVNFLVGNDEHGAKIVRTAEVLQKTPKELVDENSKAFRELKNTLNLSWDDCLRTSDTSRHWPGAQKMWRTLKESGDIYWKKYSGLYCVGHEAFITEKDLVNGKCQDHQKEPEVVEEENWFFRLSRYSQQIEDAIISGRMKIMPESRQNEILALIRGGLEDISCSRPSKDLSWGVPVPEDPTQTMYVWLEALTSYISAIGYGHDDPTSIEKFEKWWPADLQIIGKDNLRFHAAIFPGMLLSAGLSLPKAIFVHGFVTVDGQKISKTVGNVIAPETIIEKYGTDAVRYYFLREFPSSGDGDFSYQKLEERYNGNLANGIGNLVARVAALGETISPVSFDFKTDIDAGLRVSADEVFKEYQNSIETFRFNEALEAVWGLIGITDKYINERKPWENKEGSDFRITIINASYLIGVIANLLAPFLPETAEKIISQIACADSQIAIKKGDSLFPRLQ